MYNKKKKITSQYLEEGYLSPHPLFHYYSLFRWKQAHHAASETAEHLARARVVKNKITFSHFLPCIRGNLVSAYFTNPGDSLQLVAVEQCNQM